MPVGSMKESEHIGFIGAKVSHGIHQIYPQIHWRPTKFSSKTKKDTD